MTTDGGTLGGGGYYCEPTTDAELRRSLVEALEREGALKVRVAELEEAAIPGKSAGTPDDSKRIADARTQLRGLVMAAVPTLFAAVSMLAAAMLSWFFAPSEPDNVLSAISKMEAMVALVGLPVVSFGCVMTAINLLLL
ncbi:MAG: hypothetical protein WCO25_05870 [Candidatus Uhrbacteria bacterium]